MNGAEAFQWDGDLGVFSWDRLLQNSALKSSDPSFLEKVEALKGRPRKMLFEFGRVVVHLFKDPSLRKFIHSSWEEVVDIIAAQVAENNLMRRQYSFGDRTLSPMLEDELKEGNRKYCQQPCTKITTKRRVEMASRFAEKDDPILVLGDDDLVGLELARNGFRRVSVLDIDLELITSIGRLAQSENLTLDLYQHDLNDPIPVKYLKDYKRNE